MRTPPTTAAEPTRRRRTAVGCVALLAAAAIVAIATPAFAADLRICVEGAYPPFSELNAQGELIGFDVAEFLIHDGRSPTMDLDEWLAEWGVVDPDSARMLWRRVDVPGGALIQAPSGHFTGTWTNLNGMSTTERHGVDNPALDRSRIELSLPKTPSSPRAWQMLHCQRRPSARALH